MCLSWVCYQSIGPEQHADEHHEPDALIIAASEPEPASDPSAAAYTQYPTLTLIPVLNIQSPAPQPDTLGLVFVDPRSLRSQC